jgi:hypothetical protein
MENKKITNKIEIGGNFEGNSVQGDNNTIIKNDFGSDVISEAIQENSRRERWERFHTEAEKQTSREIMETIFVAFVSGIAIGAFWHSTSPLNAETSPFFVLGITLLFNILNVTHFGVRRTITMVMFLGAIYIILLNNFTIIQTSMNVNQFAGIAILGMSGAFIGLFVGLVLLFWKPLGD